MPRKIDLIKQYATFNCLIIDDLPQMRGMIKRVVDNQGMKRVDTAANAADATELCSKHSYDMLLCDYNLGTSRDGQQLLEALKLEQLVKPTSLFLMITGETSREMVLGAIEQQPDDYITKPFTPKEFCSRLDRVMIKHLVLLPIKKLFAEKKYTESLTAIDEMIAKGGRFTTEALRLKGRILFLLGELHKSREHYEKIIAKKPVPWAMLGLAETLVKLGEYDKAEKILHKVLEQDHRYVEAHDLLSEIHQKRANLEQAQDHMQQACKLSPKSVPRHRRLANLAELNDDVKTSTNSYRQAIRWGANSVHECGSDYLNYARKAAEKAGTDGSKSKEDANQALRQVRKAREDFSEESGLDLQASLIEANIKHTFNLPEAEQATSEALAKFKSEQADDCDSHLDYVRLLQTDNQNEAAQKHLETLVSNFEQDPIALRKIERLSAEPLSSEARANVARLTKAGIAAYKGKKHDDACRIFKEALGLFPNHVGLNLNLVQVLLEKNDQGPTGKDAQLVERCFERVSDISQDNAQYSRAQTLKSQFEKAYNQAS